METAVHPAAAPYFPPPSEAPSSAPPASPPATSKPQPASAGSSAPSVAPRARIVVRIAPSEPEGWTGELIAASSSSSLARELKRFATGLGLASLYGVALGARAGGLAFFKHALGVPAAMLAVAIVGVPALTIALALFDAPIEPGDAARAASRAAASAGLALAGLAPIAALYVVSSQSPAGAGVAAAAGLFFAGALALRSFLRDLLGPLAGEGVVVRTGAVAAFFVFSVFATALAIRVAWALLPILGGGR